MRLVNITLCINVIIFIEWIVQILQQLIITIFLFLHQIATRYYLLFQRLRWIRNCCLLHSSRRPRTYQLCVNPSMSCWVLLTNRCENFWKFQLFALLLEISFSHWLILGVETICDWCACYMRFVIYMICVNAFKDVVTIICYYVI